MALEANIRELNKLKWVWAIKKCIISCDWKSRGWVRQPLGAAHEWIHNVIKTESFNLSFFFPLLSPLLLSLPPSLFYPKLQLPSASDPGISSTHKRTSGGDMTYIRASLFVCRRTEQKILPQAWTVGLVFGFLRLNKSFSWITKITGNHHALIRAIRIQTRKQGLESPLSRKDRPGCQSKNRTLMRKCGVDAALAVFSLHYTAFHEHRENSYPAWSWM